MNTKNTSIFLKYCALFSLLLCVSLAGLFYILNVDFPIYILLIVFFFSFALSFLFFNFFYQKIIFGRIDDTLNKLREFRPTGQIPTNIDFVSDVSDPIERFNEEIIHLSNERQKELEHLQKLENYRKEFLGNVSHELKTPIFFKFDASILVHGERTLSLEVVEDNKVLTIVEVPLVGPN